MSSAPRDAPRQSLPVYPGAGLRVRAGANVGDTLYGAGAAAMGDVYRLDPQIRPKRLALQTDGTQFTICAGTETGRPGARLHLESALSFMDAAGEMTEALVLIEHTRGLDENRTHILPLVPLAPRTDYTLIAADTETPGARLAHVASVSFATGTHIMQASGIPILIERLKPGDKVLTRDAGAQVLRWVGRTTWRAIGHFAPVCITAGTLNNSRDLVLSPAHRLFVYQRTDCLGAGQAEVMIKARDLVNGETVYTRAGGFVDYVQLLFDAHQIVYAEGIAAESFLTDTSTAALLPPDLRETAHALTYDGFDAGDLAVNRPDLAGLVRRASQR